MESFLQLGHDSSNLISEECTNSFSGTIVSPINETPENVRSKVCDVTPMDWNNILDPQMYFPAIQKLNLAQWPHFPDAFASSDTTNESLWIKTADALVKSALACGCDSICSPAIFPKVGTDDYYSFFATVAKKTSAICRSHPLGCYATVVIRTNELFEIDRAKRIASLVSKSDAPGYYVVFYTEGPLREEPTDVDALLARMEIISGLSNTGAEVIVGYSGVDSLLNWHAGADACATGKFFNLRRFTTGRFGDEKTFGKQLPYWLEENFLTPLLASDLVDVGTLGLWSQATQDSPYLAEVLDAIRSDGKWLALSWRQYLHWFGTSGAALDAESLTAEEIIDGAIASFKTLRAKAGSLVSSEHGDQFVRAWKRAIREFDGTH